MTLSFSNANSKPLPVINKIKIASVKTICVNGSVDGVITAAKTVAANSIYFNHLKQFFELQIPKNPKRICITGI